jgi:hypothetical protein
MLLERRSRLRDCLTVAVQIDSYQPDHEVAASLSVDLDK